MKLRWNKQLVIAYKNTFESPEGKIVLDDLKKKCTINRPVAPTPGLDVNALLINTGQDNVLKHIYRMLGRDPNEEMSETARNELNI